MLRAVAKGPVWLYRLFTDSWKVIDEEAAAMPRPRGVDWAPVIVLVTCAVSLTLQDYLGQWRNFSEMFPRAPGDRYYDLKGFAWWAGWRFAGYVVMPVIVLLLWPGKRIRDCYLGFKGFTEHLWLYVVLFCLILPAVWLASNTGAFQRTYPFYKLANRSALDFWIWEAMYAIQFLSLEFFFRGFMLAGLKRTMGSAAIFVMVVPYCMIHFNGKPMSETLGAIGAGIVLGTLAMRTKSIWGGVLIHVGVALSMDFFAVSQCPPADSGLPCKSHVP